jgi:hypothetical protein
MKFPTTLADIKGATGNHDGEFWACREIDGKRLLLARRITYADARDIADKAYRGNGDCTMVFDRAGSVTIDAFAHDHRDADGVYWSPCLEQYVTDTPA